MAEGLSGLLRGVAQYINCSVTAIPSLTSNGLTKIRHVLENQRTPKSAEIICTSLAVYARKRENALLLSSDPLLDTLFDLCSSSNVVSGPAVSFFLKFLVALATFPETHKGLLSRRMLRFFETIFCSGTDAAVIILSQLLTEIASAGNFKQVVEGDPDLFIAATQAMRPGAYQSCAFLHFACANKVMCSTLVKAGLCEKIVQLFNEAPGLLGDAPVLVTFTFACTDDSAGSRIIKTNYLSHSLPLVIEAAVEGAVAPDTIALHARIVNLLCSSSAYKEKGMSGDEGALLESLKKLAQSVESEKKILVHSFVELIYSLTWEADTCKKCLEVGLLGSAHTLSMQSKELEIFTKPLRDRFLIISKDHHIFDEKSIQHSVIDAAFKAVKDRKDDYESWRFVLFVLLSDLSLGSPEIENIVKASLNNMEKMSKILKATIMATAFAISLRGNDKTQKLLSCIPSSIMAEFLSEIKNCKSIEGELSEANRPFSFSDQLKCDESTSFIEILQQLSPNVLLVSACVSISVNPTPQDIIFANSLLRYWMSMKETKYDILLVRTIQTLISVKEILNGIDMKAIILVLGNILSHKLDSDTLIGCCNIMATLLTIKENKSHVAAQQIILGLKAQLDRHKSSEPCCSAIMKVLWVLATDPTGKGLMTEAGLLDGVIKVIRSHLSCEGLLQHALKTLWSLIMRQDNREKAVSLGAIQLLSDILTRYDSTHASVVNSTLTCVKILTQVMDESCGTAIVSYKVVEKAAKIMLGEDAKVARTAAQTVYACFVFKAVRSVARKVYEIIGSRIKKDLEGAERAGEDLVLMLKLARIFASSSQTSESVVKDGLLNSVLNVDTHTRKSGASVIELELQVAAKIIRHNSAIKQLQADPLLQFVSRACKIFREEQSALGIEFLIKFVYACVSVGVLSKSNVRSGKLDGQLIDLAKSQGDEGLKTLAKSIHEGKSACRSEVSFPRSGSRADF